jgi:peptidoglycan hydrolase-like protein with peptidoglycan-binding domain
MTTIRRTGVALLAAGAFALLAGCGDDSATSTTTTTTTTANATSTTAAAGAVSARFDRALQEELRTVGCYSGSVDGILGPETDAAVLAFQRADGLDADGELGPETETALHKAVGAKRVVCGGASTTTTSAVASTTTTTAAGGPACTATALAAALTAGEKLTNFVCADGWAAGSWTNGQADGAFILKAEGTTWTTPAQDPCGSASAGVPAVILQDGCVS